MNGERFKVSRWLSCCLCLPCLFFLSLSTKHPSSYQISAVITRPPSLPPFLPPSLPLFLSSSLPPFTKENAWAWSYATPLPNEMAGSPSRRQRVGVSNIAGTRKVRFERRAWSLWWISASFCSRRISRWEKQPEQRTGKNRGCHSPQHTKIGNYFKLRRGPWHFDRTTFVLSSRIWKAEFGTRTKWLVQRNGKTCWPSNSVSMTCCARLWTRIRGCSF